MSFVIIYRKRCAERMAYRMFFLGRNFVSGLLCTLNPKKLKIPKILNNLKPFFQKNLGFSCAVRLQWWRTCDDDFSLFIILSSRYLISLRVTPSAVATVLDSEQWIVNEFASVIGFRADRCPRMYGRSEMPHIVHGSSDVSRWKHYDWCNYVERLLGLSPLVIHLYR